jgi:HPt (histidine-containing phosphotransfer) domain-containing protein
MIEKAPNRSPENFVPALDARNLAMLEALLGRERFLGAIEKFKAELAERIGAIAEERTRATEKGAHAHKLIGTAGIMGLKELAEASRQLELAVVQKSDLQHRIATVLAAAERAKIELDVLSVRQ